MIDYIDRKALLDSIRTDTAPFNIAMVFRHIHNIPAADVVEVTFCKDCRYYQDAKVNEKGFLICPASGMEITETDYCSYGERMDKEDEHEAN